MRLTERKIQRQLESLEEDQSDCDGAGIDPPLAVTLREDPTEGLPDPPHGDSGIRTYTSREAAEAELGEDFWSDPTIKIWDFLDESDTPTDDGS